LKHTLDKIMCHLLVLKTKESSEKIKTRKRESEKAMQERAAVQERSKNLPLLVAVHAAVAWGCCCCSCLLLFMLLLLGAAVAWCCCCLVLLLLGAVTVVAW
jgi:Flp pilus assembly protein TadB